MVHHFAQTHRRLWQQEGKVLKFLQLNAGGGLAFHCAAFLSQLLYHQRVGDNEKQIVIQQRKDFEMGIRRILDADIKIQFTVKHHLLHHFRGGIH